MNEVYLSECCELNEEKHREENMVSIELRSWKAVVLKSSGGPTSSMSYR